nr:hypothetical protein [Tanacetum cinerariifolium]
MSIEIRKKEKLLQQEQWAYLSTHPSKCLHSFCYDDDDDEDYTSAIPPDEPVLSTEEPDNSLSMGAEHLDTIPATESDEFIKSSVENLIPIPSESEGFPTIDKIDYVKASPPDSELVSSEVMEIVIPKVGGIEASNDNPIPFYDPIIFGIPPNLTPSGEKGDMLLLKAFLNDDHSFDFKTKSSSTSLNSLLEETNNFNNSLPEFTTFSKVLFDAECESDSSDDQSCSDEDEKLLQQEHRAYLSTHPSKRLTSFCYYDDDDYTSAITPDEPVLSTEEPDNSLSMEDEHLDTIPATESDEFIKSSVENLIPIPSESEGIPEHKCDVPFHDNSPPLDVSKDQFKDLFESNDEFYSTDDDCFSFDKIDYVEASPPDSELVSSEVMEIVISKVGVIEASNDNPIPFYDPVISVIPPNLTPFGESDFFLEGDMLLSEAFLNDDHSFDFKTKSSSTSLNSLLEETNNFNNSLPEFTTFSKVLFDVECEFDSSDAQSCSDEDVLEKIISKPLCKEEIIPIKSLRTHDSSLSISSKIDSLLDEFASEFTLLKSIPSGIDETDCDFEEDIRLIEKLFDSLVEEIDLFCTPDYPIPPGIVEKDYDSERDILIPKDLPRNNTLSFAKKESFYFDIPPFSCPPAKPPDGDTGILNIKMMADVFDQKAFMHKLMITLASHQEKSPDLLSHRCGTVKKFNTHQQSSLGCSSVPFLSPLIHSSMGEFGPAHLTLNKRFVKENPKKDKIGQKGEAWQSQEKSEAVTVNRARKTEENAKKGPEMQTHSKF